MYDLELWNEQAFSVVQAVSDQMQRPLQLILLDGAYLQSKLQVSSPQVLRTLQSMEYAALQLQQLVQDCRDLLACSQEDGLCVQLLPVDIAAVLRRVSDVAGWVKTRIGVQIRLDPSVETCGAITDPELCERILESLVVGMLQCSEEGDAVLLSAASRPQGCVITLRGSLHCETVLRQNFGAEPPRLLLDQQGQSVGLYLARALCSRLNWRAELDTAEDAVCLRLCLPAQDMPADGRLIFCASGQEDAPSSLRYRRALQAIPGMEDL